MRVSMFAVSVSVLAIAAPAFSEIANVAPEEEPIIIEGERSSYGAAKIVPPGT